MSAAVPCPSLNQTPVCAGAAVRRCVALIMQPFMWSTYWSKARPQVSRRTHVPEMCSWVRNGHGCRPQVPRVSFFFCNQCNVIQPAVPTADLFLLLDL